MDNQELEKRLKWYETKYGPYIEKRGIDNWKNLFRKPNLLEWTILIMLILAIFMGYAYMQDIKSYKDVVANPCSYCSDMMNPFINDQNTYEGELDIIFDGGDIDGKS